MKLHRRFLTVAGLAVGAILMATGVTAAGGVTQTIGALGAGSIVNSGAVTAVSVATDAPNQTTTSTTYVDMPGMQTTITVPSTYAKGGLIMARFSAESGCYGAGTAGNWCTARILVDGVEASPGDGTDYAFDTSTGTSSINWGGHSMDRSIHVGPGPHQVDVQWAVTNFTSGTTFWTGERSLTVELAKG